MKLSEQIIKIRNEHNLTQEQFANELFVTRQAVSKWERGLSIPDIEIIKQISKKYNISLNVLLEIVDDAKKEERIPLAYKSYKNIIRWFYIFVLSIILFVLYFFINCKDPNYFGTKFLAFLAAVMIVISCFLIFLNISKPKILIEYNDYGVFLTEFKNTFIRYEDIVDVTIYHQRLKRMVLSYGSVSIITKNNKYQINGVKEIDNVMKMIVELKAKNTINF